MHILKNTAFILFAMLSCMFAEAQDISGYLSGTVSDSVTKKPLALVSVVIKDQKKGTVTDIDGRFNLQGLSAQTVLQISFVGYKTKLVMVDAAKPEIHVSLVPSGKQLEEVIITSGENPAHRIIRLLQQNKKRNDPSQLPSFRYHAYTIAALASGSHFWNMNAGDTSRKKKGISIKNKTRDTVGDGLNGELARRFKENYLMLTESYTERIFRFPRQSKETVLATRITGLKNASFAVTASNFQPFGFYEEHLEMNDASFVSPVANGSISMYRFTLNESILHESDTTFMISYEPRPGKNFNGLKGILYINSDGYAIENVLAAPADEEGMIFTFSIRQKYTRHGAHWFPEQLNSILTQRDIRNDSVLLYWDSRCYISQVAIGTPISKRSFSDVTMEYHPLAGRRTDTSWISMRADTLTQKEKATYETYEMLPPRYRNTIEKVNRIAQVLSIEAIPWGNVDIPFKYMLSGVNKYELFRLGGGLRTNPGFSRLVTLEGHAGYGFRDKAWKYGAGLVLNLDDRTGTSAAFHIARDITEPGKIDYFTANGTIFSSQSLRNLQVSRMDSVRFWKIDLQTRLRPFLQVNAWLLNEERNPAGYAYEFRDDINKVNYRAFKNTEIGAGMRLAVGESFIRMGRAKIRSKPPDTQLLIQVSKGLDGFSGDLDYTRLALQFSHHFRINKLGLTSFQLDAGNTWGDPPYSYLFNARASRSGNRVSIYIPNTFQTVGLYEFYAGRSVSLFMQHNFGNLLFKPSNLSVRPEILLVQNISFGALDNRSFHRLVDAKVPEKGIFESGLLVKNIYRKSIYSLCYLGFGGGVFYRYGHYALPRSSDNWVFKWGFSISF